MRSFEKDYKYLLLNLVPRHRLSPERRKSIERAIASGDPNAIRMTAILVLEDLCVSDDFHRSDPLFADDRLFLTYIKKNGNYQFRLELPRDQWLELGDRLNIVPPEPDGQVPPAPVPPQPEPAPRQPEPVEISIEIVPEIIRCLNISEQRESTLQRLDHIVELLPMWLRFKSARLVLVEERMIDREAETRFVSSEPEASFTKSAIYERCRRSGRPEIVGIEGARALGLEYDANAPSAPWPADVVKVAIAPVFVLGNLWGMVELWVVSGQNGPMLENRAEIAARVIEQTIENATKLETLTSIDKLTSIYNRAFYDRQGPIEVERATRSGSKLSLLVLDIDDFRGINNTLGHQRGDEALALVSDLIKDNLRKIDLPFRYGGEEFAILLPGTAQVEAVHTAERLRVVIRESSAFAAERGQPLRITVSIGGAVFPDHARTLNELFVKADMALLRAKQRGKDRVEFYTE